MNTISEAVDLNALTHWMDSQNLGSGDISNAHLLTGGTQNILLQFDRAGRSYVLRRPPVHTRVNSNKTMQREAKVLSALAGSKVPHPGFIAACEDTEVLGANFYLMEPIIGFNVLNSLPELHKSSEEMQRRMAFSHIEALTALGEVDYKAVGLEDFGKIEGYLTRQAPRWLDQLERYKKYPEWPGLGNAESIDTIARWLDDNCPSTFEPGVLHGDAHFGNVMFKFDSGEVAALIDWELATIGDPLIDLGWIIATWPEPDGTDTLVLEGADWDVRPSIEELIEHYGKHSHRDLSNITWYGVLGCFKLAIILEGTYARYCAGKAPKDVAERLHDSALRLIARALKLIGESK
ncbi:phosphotransferase family protein [Zhongshania aliphaticivorans]|uniref:phosphotransferase family protein n=1 Tax=Zhongshania aliphaticivorans TaxID=1470434 RepID=UPI00190F9761|nr:phosphotransferase family protein [Zhongshania aliphaticivorans]